jgi:hypothetical protein
MGMVDRLNAHAVQVKEGVKSSGVSFILLVLKLLSGLIIGLTFAIMFQEIAQFGQLSFLFIIVLVTTLFAKLTKSWGFVTLIIFDLICVLVAMLLRMYILIGPG